MGVPDGRESSEPPPSRRVAGRKVNIGAIVFDSDLEILVNVGEDFVF
jgi:hypothetical protein